MKKVQEKIDPTLPFTEIEIDGTKYKMCFDHGALAAAEEKLIAAGHYDANLLFRCPPFTFSGIRVLFAASLLAYQPETDFEAAKKLVTLQNKMEIFAAVLAAWKVSMPGPEEEDAARPPEPADQ